MKRVFTTLIAALFAMTAGLAQAQGDSSDLQKWLQNAPMYELKGGKFVRLNPEMARKIMASRPKEISEGDSMFAYDFAKMGPMYAVNKEGKLVRIDMDKGGKVMSVRYVDTGQPIGDSSTAHEWLNNTQKFIRVNGMWVCVDDMPASMKK